MARPRICRIEILAAGDRHQNHSSFSPRRPTAAIDVRDQQAYHPARTRVQLVDPHAIPQFRTDETEVVA